MNSYTPDQFIDDFPNGSVSCLTDAKKHSEINHMAKFLRYPAMKQIGLLYKLVAMQVDTRRISST